MKRLKYYILLMSIFTLTINPLFAIPSPSDPCILQLDKSFYVSGEVIWFKIYLPVESKGHPFSLRVGLLDSNGKLVDYFFLPTQGKTYASGYYKIPFDWASGVYQLVCSAQEQASKQTILLAKTRIPVYNDLEKPKVTALASFNKNQNNTLNNSNLQVEINLNKNNYKSRETVQATVTVKDASGKPVKANISAAVTDWSLAGDNILNQANITTGFPLINSNLDSLIYTQVNITGSPAQQSLMGIYIPKNWNMMYASPNPDGQFYIRIPTFYGEKNIQCLGYPNPDIQVEMNDPLRSMIEPAPALTYTEGILKYLEFSRERKKIFQLYTTLETNLNIIPIEEKVEPLKPDRTIQIDQYDAFEDMATFFREIITPLNFKLDRKQNHYTAKMFNPGRQEEYAGNPIFIIDGKVTRDADFVARLKMNQIKQVDLYYVFDKIYNNFRVIGSSGVVNITSKSGILLPETEEADVFTLKGWQIPADFPAFQADQINNKNQPFFRPQLYWNPNLTTDANGQMTFSFVQSDDLSTFRIEVLAQAEDGSMGHAWQEYVVSW